MFMGDILIYLKAIGLREGNNDILPLISLIGSGFILDEFSFNDVHNVYYKFFDGGVEFNFDNNILSSIIFYITPEDEYSPYKSLPNLVNGLSVNSTRMDVLSIFGEPFSSGKDDLNWIKYNIIGKFIHFEFNDNSIIKKVTLIK